MGKQCNTMIEMIGDIQRYTQTNEKKNTQENIFMPSDCTARSEPIKYNHKSIYI